jgi:hypothetical protein
VFWRGNGDGDGNGNGYGNLAHAGVVATGDDFETVFFLASTRTT